MLPFAPTACEQLPCVAEPAELKRSLWSKIGEVEEYVVLHKTAGCALLAATMLLDSWTCASKPPRKTLESEPELPATVLLTRSGPRSPDGMLMYKAPPLCADVLPVIRFWTMVASDWLTMKMPPPPCPLHPTCLKLPVIVLSRMTGEANATEMPVPSPQAVLAVMTLPRMVGEELVMWTPAPSYPNAKGAVPCWRVKPWRTAAVVSAFEKFTTGAIPPPSMVVTLGPCALWTVISLPLKLTFSK